jgi:hypothetical protein
MELLRPQRWIDLLGLDIEQIICLESSDLGAAGFAKVVGIGDCPPICAGDGRVVIGRFVTRQASNLMQVTLSDGQRIVGTDSHKFWSVNTQQWTRLKDLCEGERLLALDGEQAVQSVEGSGVIADVYNIEVDGEHVFRLLSSGILVHNANYINADAPFYKLGKTFWVDPVETPLGRAALHRRIDDGLDAIDHNVVAVKWDDGTVETFVNIKGKHSARNVLGPYPLHGKVRRR